MKTRSTLILILLVFTSASLQAQTWNGSTSNDWNLPANWTGGVPGPGSNVTIPGGTPFSPKLFSNVSINGLNMTNATLDVNGFTFSFTSQGFYSRLDGATINNSSASTDIMFTINTGNTGHDLIIKASTFNDHVTMNLTGTNTFYEGGSAINNVFNGNYTANINGNMSAQFSVTSASVVTGNFLVDRTTAGSTLLFSSGGQVNGNFTYTNNAGGASQIGNMTTTSTINGTMNMSVNDPSPYTFWMYRMKNLTNGGSINVLNPLAFEVKNDTLKVNSLSITGYRGSAYTYLYSNSILGNVTISDDASYSGGHTTTINNNAITGNTSFTISGLNSFYECGVAGSGNTYNGTTSFTINGGSAVFFSYAASSMYNGNLTINRTQTGSSSLFPAGATITGNFTFNHSASGASQIGNTSILTQVQGKVFMNVNYTAKQSFELYRIKNFTAGGKMNITNTMGCNIQMDSLIVDSLNITQYGGNAYAYFQYNQLTGNLTLSTDSFYNGGHNTQIHSNVINGHSAFGNYGANYMQESVSASGANTFNGNTTFIGGGPGTIYISHDAKSTFNGNLTILRPASGNTRAFAQGANITGNLSYTKTSVSGVTQFGNTAAKTMINGMVNMSVVQTTSDEFEIFWMENLLNGGSISVNGSKAFYLTKDTLKLTSLSLSGYAGNAYGYLINNFITGNISTSDLPAYNNGYVTYIRNNTFTGNSSFTINGANTFVEADGTGNKNTFNGNTLFTINNSGGVYISHDAHSIFNGHLTVNRTVAGVTQMFYNGADITGNYTYTNSAGGNSILGRTTLKTIINGTININSTQNTGNEFDMYYVQNSTGGGTISVNGCKAPDIQKDTIMVTNFSITGYGGNGYAYLLNNHITGNVNLSDNGPTYSNGYVSYMRKNVIIGNVTITLTGNNTFVEADGTGNGDIITGNTLFNINGPGSVYISEDAKSIFNGNLTLNRTVAGYTRMFYSGTDLNGNLNCTNTAGGAMYMGRTTLKTTITGTIQINSTQSTADLFYMYYIQNQTGGGTVTVTGCKAPDIQKDTLIVNSFNINGYGGGDYATFYSNQITGNVNLSDAASYTGGYNSSSRYNTIYGNTQITINGTNQYYESNVANSGNTYYGNVTYIRNGGQINIESSDSTSIAGDLTIQSSTPLNLAKIRFFSNTPSVIDQLGSALITIENLIVDKTGAGKLTLAEPVSIITNTAFVNGYVYTSAVNPLIFRDNATHLTASDNSHVIGQVMKIGNDIFTFPLGNGIGLNTIGISAPSNTTDSVAATIVLNDANLDGYNRASKDPTILQLVPYHYWTLNRISGSNALSIKLGWGNPCVNAGITNLPTLTVARWDGLLWDDLGNSATSGTTSSGTVTMTGTTTSYGPFLLGTTSNLNQWQVTSVTASASTVCQGVSTTLSGSGANTYTWMPGSLSGTSVIVTPLSTTTYTVTGTSATGCITTATKTITVNPLPTTSTSISSNPICAGNATTITASGANAGYVWQPGGMTTTAITVSPASSTTYTVTGTNTFGCTLSATRTVTVNPLPSVGTTVTNATICAGTSTSITGTGANTYTWMPGSLSGTTVNVSPASTTTYTVTGTNTATGCTNTATRTITVNSLPTVGTTVTNATICSGTSTSMTGTGANTYTWMPGSLSGTTVNVSPASTTTYTVTGTNTATGCTNTATRTITVNSLPTVGTTVTNATICAGTSTSITGTGANTYTWMPGSLSGTTVSVSPASTTTYTVTGTNTTTGCTNTATRTITVNALPSVGTTVTNATICSGTSTSMTGTGANTYTWMPGSLSGTTVNVSPASTTTYTVTGTNTATGCTNTATRTITVNSLPTVGTTVTNATICAGTSTSITGTGANTYTWMPGSLSGTTVSVSPASTTTYTVTGTNTATGCTNTATRTITVTPCNSVLNLKLYLQGYYIGSGFMTPVLQNQGVSTNPLLVDSINVELRNTTAPYAMVGNSKTILNTNGTATCTFGPVNGNYYVVIKHRNTVQTWSANPVTISTATAANYDFSNLITKAYGSNQVQMGSSPAIFALYSADVNQDENVDLLDMTILDTDINNFAFGYIGSDFNGDGNVDLLDVPVVEGNVNAFIYSVHP